MPGEVLTSRQCAAQEPTQGQAGRLDRFPHEGLVAPNEARTSLYQARQQIAVFSARESQGGIEWRLGAAKPRPLDEEIAESQAVGRYDRSRSHAWKFVEAAPPDPGRSA